MTEVVVGVPWRGLQPSELRKGLVILGERSMIDEAPSRCITAYCTLRTMYTKVLRNRRPPEVMRFHMSVRAGTELAQELANIPELSEIRTALTAALSAQEKERESQRAGRHYRTPIRERRSVLCQRPSVAVGAQDPPAESRREDGS